MSPSTTWTSRSPSTATRSALRCATTSPRTGYRARYGGRWAASAADPYLARALAGHLRDANLIDELHAVLADTEWIQARLAHGQLPELIADYGYSDDVLSQQILRATNLGQASITVEGPHGP
jgi:hypothetical protein